MALRTTCRKPTTNHARIALAHSVEKWLVPLIENIGDNWQCFSAHALLHAEAVGCFLYALPGRFN